MGHVIVDIKMKVQEFFFFFFFWQKIQDFKGWQIMFIKREGYQVAHLLAKSAVQHVLNSTTWREAPSIKYLIIISKKKKEEKLTQMLVISILCGIITLQIEFACIQLT
jgi:hypothetical protein